MTNVPGVSAHHQGVAEFVAVHEAQEGEGDPRQSQYARRPGGMAASLQEGQPPLFAIKLNAA